MIPRPAECEKLNDAQCAALDLERDMLVDAGAGAGKTLVLALRVLALVEHGRAKISEIVAFTFTDKAAAEMRSRVQDFLLRRIALLEEIAQRNAEAAERVKLLRAARGEFNQCRITTVHGFCHRLLVEHAWEAGLEPGAPMLDDREQRLARDAAIARVLTRTSESADAEAAAALTRLGTITRLGVLSTTLDRMLRERHEVQPAMARAAAAWADPTAEIERRRKAHEATLAEAMAPCVDALNKLPFAALNSINPDDTLRGVLESVGAALNHWPSVAAATELKDLLLQKNGKPRAFSKASRKNWARALDAMEGALATLSGAAAMMEEHAHDVLRYAFDVAHELRAGAAVRDLGIVFSRVLAAYEEERAGRLDYLELELGTLKLLRSDAALHEAICRRIRYMLIDEFQDTNPTQSELFALLIAKAHSPGRLFAVGDAKQSIYGFRGADVGVFNDARTSIPARNAAAGAVDSQRLPYELKCDETSERKQGLVSLDTNYRTVAALLKAGNTLLDFMLKREDYRRFDARPQSLDAGRKEAGVAAPLELHLLPGGRDDEAGASDEPELLAQIVKRLVGEGVKLSEIAILVRRKSRNAEFARVFARYRLPLVAIGEGGLLQTQEALDCINILRALASPGDDIALLGWLRSPLGGLSDDALMSMAPGGHGHTDPLFKRLERAVLEAEDDRIALARFRSAFAELAARAGRDAPADLLSTALERCGAAMAVSCGAQAEQRSANLQRMVEVVRELEPRFPSLAALARELSRRVDEEEDESQGEPEQGGEFVRLMTIHGAKGLEFPVVIVPEIGNMLSGGDHALLQSLPSGSNPLGLHLPWLGDDDERGRLKPDFEAWRAGRDNSERERAEYRRLFYVAFTRARDRLILSGAVRSEIQSGRRAAWADLLLGALGCEGFGATARELPGLKLHWWRALERAAPRPLASDVQRCEAAQVAGEIELPCAIDASLSAPLAQPEQKLAVAPEAAEFGKLVHAELERRILARMRGAKVANSDGDVGRHADIALAALGTLRKARELPEWRMFSEESERRIDLLRALDGDEFEIVDYKTDVVEGDPEAHARKEHSEQLRQYAGMLRKQLGARGLEPRKVRLLVCFTAPGIADGMRLVEIKESP